MNWVRRNVLCLVALLMIRTALHGQAVATGVAGVVNDVVITIDDVEKFSRQALRTAYKQIYSSSWAMGNPARADEAWLKKRTEILRDALEQLIEHELILHEFKTAGYNLPEVYIEDHINNTIREEYGDRITLVKTLHEEHDTMEHYRKVIRDNLIIGLLTSKNVRQNIIISPKKIETYYKDNAEKYSVGDRAKVRVIVIGKTKRGAEEAAKLAAEVQKKAAGGADFSALADEFSDDARTKKGGERGWIENKEADLRKELREFAFSAQSGAISPVIATEEVFFIVKVEERETAHTRPLSEVRTEVEKTLKAVESERLRKKWITKLRNKSLVKYF
jgi:parvulin-like peptidyl-prolyl isomerase